MPGGEVIHRMCRRGRARDTRAKSAQAPGWKPPHHERTQDGDRVQVSGAGVLARVRDALYVQGVALIQHKFKGQVGDPDEIVARSIAVSTGPEGDCTRPAVTDPRIRMPSADMRPQRYGADPFGNFHSTSP